MESGKPLDKAVVDASTFGNLTVSVDPSTRGGLQPTAIAEAVLRVIQDAQKRQTIFIGTLRLVLVTGQIGEAAKYWQRALGLPEAGTSDQPEGTAAGKHMSWGTDPESARSIIILADYIAIGLVSNNDLAIACFIHELGHVQDDFARGVVMGFRQSQTPHLNNWPGICAYFAENIWAEFAAETFAADYFTPAIRADLFRNDRDYLLGIHNRLQQSVSMLRVGGADFHGVWSRAVTDVCNIFSNLGRGVARYLTAIDGEDAFPCSADRDGEAACWKPVIERLIHELQALAAKGYAEWGDDPFSGLKQIVTAGFESAGFLPTWNGHRIHVNLR